MRRPSCLLTVHLFISLLFCLDVSNIATGQVQPRQDPHELAPGRSSAQLSSIEGMPSERPRFELPRFEPPPAQPPRVVSPWLAIHQHAGFAFEGTVLRVEPQTDQKAKAVPTVKITFRVQHAIRGVRDGQILTIHEWAGLWVAQARYRPGEQLILFLYPPSRLGLTSPVTETAGRFVVSPGREVRFSRAQQAWFANEEGGAWRERESVPVTEFLKQARQQIGEQP
jgi:hypothetical protein